jgi:hypothetical protein
MNSYPHHILNVPSRLIINLICCMLMIAKCHSWVECARMHRDERRNLSLSMVHNKSPSRRQVLRSLVRSSFTSSAAVFMIASRPALARNLPVSNGADTSKVGTVDALKPIVLFRYSLSDLKMQLTKGETLNLEGFPTEEEDFKRIFDAYSDPVSYKQKFLDQNAFLVYYTKGFDGPGRPNIEDDINERQTIQFGTRNEAWINWQNVLVELKFVEDEDNECLKYLTNTIRSVDTYLKLAPQQDLKEAQRAVDVSW